MALPVADTMRTNVQLLARVSFPTRIGADALPVAIRGLIRPEWQSAAVRGARAVVLVQ